MELRLTNISLKFDEKQIVKNFDLHIKSGEKVALKAPSGAGKTSILNVILGFIDPQEGEVQIDGQELLSSNISEIRRRIAWLPQEFPLNQMGVSEALMLPFSFKFNQDITPTPVDINKGLEELGLSSRILERSLEETSTGERQRLGILLCLLLSREMILLDEPSSALDERSRQQAIDLLFDNPGQTMISASHDPVWLERCDRVIELN